MSPQRHIVLNAILVAGAFLVAAAMGLVRNIIIARTFGIDSQLDAFYAAFKLPDLLFTIVAGGALATAFIPIFAEYLANADTDGGWRLSSAVTNWVVLVVSSLSMLAAIVAPWLVRTLIAPGFEPALQAETAALMRIVLLSTLFFGVSAVQSSALHGFKHFLMPALAPILYPVGVIVGALWLVPSMGVAGLAWGAVLGSFFHLAVKVPVLMRYGFRWSPTLGLGSADLRRVFVLMGPRVLDLGVFHVGLLAMTNLASRLGAGSVAALEWGWEFMQLPETVIGTAFGLVIFPTLAEMAAKRDLDALRTTFGNAIRLLLALTVPASLGLVLLGYPLIQLVYQRGEFDDAAGLAVYTALQFFALGLVSHVCLEVVARLFFAQKDTLTPLLVAAGAGIFQVVLGFGLMTSMGHGGLALANSVAITLEVLVLMMILQKRLKGIEIQKTVSAFIRILGATAIMGFVIVLLGFSGEIMALPLVWSILLPVVVGGAAYVLAALGLKVWRVEDVAQFIRV